ncbi:MAG TPA: DEAD/DEAH box helicase, partial [Blastocatellia bacterium]|nr:DEAD/DEAH box helicase [Blastocatellia bacterium]
QMPRLPKLELPDELKVEEDRRQPVPLLTIREVPTGYRPSRYLVAEVTFDYGGELLQSIDPRRGIFHPEQKKFTLRARQTEQARITEVLAAGASGKWANSRDNGFQMELRLKPTALPRAVSSLVAKGWRVEAEGKIYRQPGRFQFDVVSDIDWFDLEATVEFDDQVCALPELLKALRRGEGMVSLGDGSFGMLPEQWLRKYAYLAGAGVAEDGRLRFTRHQIGFLDALLAEQPEATFDEAFKRAREQLRGFEGIKAADPPSGFTGQLRTYQKEGLAWLYFLQAFGFGGCLADCMGLGKTIQALALLQSRREMSEPSLSSRVRGKAGGAAKSRASKKAKSNGTPASASRLRASLLVVPRSLVFNWKEEARRFAPDLRILDHTGADRLKTSDHFENHDVVITTYGTLRRDVLQFRDLSFDYVILDEAQAIKNAQTDTAKAVRLLKGDHRLALSGTPIENHLGELWSLFEFLNPGMLGAASVFKQVQVSGKNLPEDTRPLLARALRPFILRRTKDQVAKDLPEKLEQTIYCEMEAVQRKLYDELRDHYRAVLLGKIARDGLAKSKIQVLEALLRLRQAACHPGLIDKARTAEPSAKLDVLIPRLMELLDEGHKVLVFSQFTSLLTIVRQRLDTEKLQYEYLDGKTVNRAACVDRFQHDPDCKLFLISLKAGGLGLNLTAAEYVFLLDPWWNPAVEAQAVDRAHRIGQTRRVFACRLITRGTVEEKVLELQNTKRDLADAIINANNSLIKTLGRDDLEILLS